MPGWTLVDVRALQGPDVATLSSVTDRGYGQCDIDVAMPVSNGRTARFIVSVDISKVIRTAHEYYDFYQTSVERKAVDGYPVYSGVIQPFSSCFRGISLPEGHTVVVSVEPMQEDRNVTCQVADAALHGTVSLLRSGHVGRLHWGAGSPAAVDLCQALDGPAQRALGSAVVGEHEFGVFECDWNALPSTVSAAQQQGAYVKIAASGWPSSAIGRIPVRFSGRDAFCDFSKIDGGLPTAGCTVDYGNSPFEGKDTVLTVGLLLKGVKDLRPAMYRLVSQCLDALSGKH